MSIQQAKTSFEVWSQVRICNTRLIRTNEFVEPGLLRSAFEHAGWLEDPFDHDIFFSIESSAQAFLIRFDFNALTVIVFASGVALEFVTNFENLKLCRFGSHKCLKRIKNKDNLIKAIAAEIKTMAQR